MYQLIHIDSSYHFKIADVNSGSSIWAPVDSRLHFIAPERTTLSIIINKGVIYLYIWILNYLLWQKKYTEFKFTVHRELHIGASRNGIYLRKVKSISHERPLFTLL